jgi:two-component system cell cycle sensor histidine kinase/response regulator CckA
LRESSERSRLAEVTRRLAEHAAELEAANTRLTAETEARRRLERELMQAQKMESIGRVAGGLAHDFNNVLSVVLSSLDLADAPSASRDDVAIDIQTAREAVHQATRLTRQLLAFARHQPVEAVSLRLDAVIASAADVIRRLAGETIEVQLRLEAGDAAVRSVPSQLEQVLLNLVSNAADAMPHGGIIRLQTRRVQLPPGVHGALASGGEFVELDVHDTGPGIPEEALSKIFEPFFSTKTQGTGLGLATTYAIVARAGGTIEASNAPEGGALFRVLLPLVDDARRTAEHPIPAPRAHCVGRVLLVEDKEEVRLTAQRVLVGAGFEVAAAANGRAALELVDDWSRAPDAVVTDVVMPHVGGRMLAERLRSRWPELPVLFVSGYTDEEVLRDDDARSAFLQKPFSRDALIAAVAGLLAANAAAVPNGAASASPSASASASAA